MDIALYILCEGEYDEVFYERVLERLLETKFSRPEEFRYRPGENWKTVQQLAKKLLARFSRFEGKQQIAVLIALDNDRAPGHPGGRTYPKPLPSIDQKKEARYPALQALVSESLGEHAEERNVRAAVAMPVEMIESWLLLLLDPEKRCNDLPAFSKQDSAIARLYHGRNPQPQLKDCCAEEQKSRNLDKLDFYCHAADSEALTTLSQRSMSFRVFEEEILKWRDQLNGPK